MNPSLCMDLFLTFLSNVLFAIVFLAVLTSAGGGICKLLHFEVDDLSFRASTSFLAVVLIVWIFRKIINFAEVEIFAIVSIILFGALYIRLRRSRVKDLEEISQIGLTVLIVSSLYSYVAHGSNIALLGNNDLFNWYAVASHFSGNGNYFNMAPIAEASFNGAMLHTDGFGTDWFLVFAAFGVRETILSSQVAMIILGSWVALSLQDQLDKITPDGSIYKIILTSFVVGTPLFVYIVFNGFFAQLLGTVAGIQIISGVLEVYLKPSLSLFRRFFIFFVPSAFLLLAYQSGFLIFQITGFGLAVFISLSGGDVSGKVQLFGGIAKKILLPGLLVAICSYMLMPEMVNYLIERTIQVSSISAGWPLPPFIPEFIRHHFSVFSIPIQVIIVYGGLTFFVQLIALLIYWRFTTGRLQRVLFGGSFWFSVLIVIYFAWFISGKTPYQNWKYASFILYTLGFVYLAPFTIFRYLMKTDLRNFLKSQKVVCLGLVLVAAIFILGSISYLIKYHKRVVIFDQNVIDLVRLKKSIPLGGPVILDLPPFGYSMLAMQVLSKFNPLYPVSQTYISPVSQAEISRLENPLLLQQKTDCYQKRIYDALYESPHYILGYEKIDGKHFGDDQIHYDFSKNCLPSWLALETGFSGWEPWGRWSDGGAAKARIALPHYIKKGQLILESDVAPYLSPQLNTQHVIIKINNILAAKLAIKKRESIKVIIPESARNNAYIDVMFEFPNATSPAANGDIDHRLLGLAFYSIKVYAYRGILKN